MFICLIEPFKPNWATGNNGKCKGTIEGFAIFVNNDQRKKGRRDVVKNRMLVTIKRDDDVIVYKENACAIRNRLFVLKEGILVA